jgi:hypothetical protein
MGLSIGDIEKKTGGDQDMVRRAGLSLGELTKTNEAITRAEGWTVDVTDNLIEGGCEVDASISMTTEYNRGTVQAVAERVLAFYAVVDNDGIFPVGFFGTSAGRPVELTLENYLGWVGRNVPSLGSTNLFEAIYRGAEMAAQALGKPEIMNLVAYNSGMMGGFKGWKTPYEQLRPVSAQRIFHFTVITDGAPTAGPGNNYYQRRDLIKELIQRMSYAGIFIKFIFVGSDPEGSCRTWTTSSRPSTRTTRTTTTSRTDAASPCA